jgi:hypothetical protein
VSQAHGLREEVGRPAQQGRAEAGGHAEVVEAALVAQVGRQQQELDFLETKKLIECRVRILNQFQNQNLSSSKLEVNR